MGEVGDVFTIDVGHLLLLFQDARPDLFNLQGIFLGDLEEDVDQELCLLRGAELRFLRDEVLDDLRFLGADGDKIIFGEDDGEGGGVETCFRIDGVAGEDEDHFIDFFNAGDLIPIKRVVHIGILEIDQLADLIDIIGGSIFDMNPASLFWLRDFYKFLIVLALVVDRNHPTAPSR